MRDAAEWFRPRLAARLRAAMVERDHEAIRTLRCLMAAIDNAGAVSPAEAARHASASASEVPRRCLSEPELTAILQAEIDTRNKAADAYERGGLADQAAQLRGEVATIEQVMALRG